MYLFLPGWTTVIPYYQGVLASPLRVSSWSRMLQHVSWQELRADITPVLSSLHWLPVKSRTEFKILLLTSKALNGQTAKYLKDLLEPSHPTRALRSQHAGLLGVPKSLKAEWEEPELLVTKLLFCGIIFLFWSRGDTLSVFKRRLKTFLLDSAYS